MALPTCPNPAHKGSKVVLAGLYGSPGERRQRFKCTPVGGAAPHRFTPELTRHPAPATHCSECSARLESWNGQAGARAYQYDARTIARALVRIAQGASYREASSEIREDRIGSRLNSAEQDARLVANWVDVYAKVVVGPRPNMEVDETAAWPEVITADETPFHRIRRQASTRQAWYALCVAGSNTGGDGEPWALTPSPSNNQDAWEVLFASKIGTPRVLVTDDAKQIRAAARVIWPKIDIYYCVYHLRENFRRNLPSVGTNPALDLLLERAFFSEQDWGLFGAGLVKAYKAGEASLRPVHEFRRVDSDIRWQLMVREPGDAMSNGAAEKMCRALNSALPRVRSSSMSNLYRADNLFTLLLAHQQGRDRELEWAVAIRKDLERRHGQPPQYQKQHDDAGGVPSLFGAPAKRKVKRKAAQLRTIRTPNGLLIP